MKYRCINCTNVTSNTSATKVNTVSYYVSPANFRIQLAIVCPTIVPGVYALVANSLILYFMRKKMKRVPSGAFRRVMVDYFIQSLAWSDVLCSLISLPVLINEIFESYITSELVCKITKYVQYFFPVVTCMNYLFIAIERFIMVYFPYVVPSDKTCKSLVVAAWIIGGLIALLPMHGMAPVKIQLPNNRYTMLCKYDTTVNYASQLFLAFLVSFYVIPFLTMFVTCVMILCKVRKQRAVIPATSEMTSNAQNARARQARQSKLHYMFISLICAFVLPYFSYICYNGAANLLKLNSSLMTDYVVRYVSGALAYANGAVGSTIFFCCYPYLRKKLRLLYRSIFTRNEVLPAIQVNVTRLETVSGRQREKGKQGGEEVNRGERGDGGEREQGDKGENGEDVVEGGKGKKDREDRQWRETKERRLERKK